MDTVIIHTGLDVSELPWILSSVVSLVSVVIMAIVAVRTGRSTMLAPLREKWIDNLRNLIAEFQSASQFDAVAQLMRLPLTSQEVTGMARELDLLRNKILLLLNSEHESHRSLESKLEEVIQAITGSYKGTEPPDIGVLQEQMMLCARKALKEAWEDTKR